MYGLKEHKIPEFQLLQIVFYIQKDKFMTTCPHVSFLVSLLHH